MSVQRVIEEFELPRVGRCMASVTDETWQDDRGIHPMQLWAAEVSTPALPGSHDFDFWLSLDRAAERYVADMKHYAEVNSISIDELVTCPLRCTPPQERHGLIISYLYGRVGQLEHGN